MRVSALCCLDFAKHFKFLAAHRPIALLLECAYKNADSRKKSAIKNIHLSDLGWQQQHIESYNDIQRQLQDSVKSSHRDPEKVLRIYTYSSDKNWEAAATQFDHAEISEHFEDQRHSPLAFLSGAFTALEDHWTTYEKGEFSIKQTFQRLEYLLECEHTTRVFTDHRNLLFMFNYTTLETSLGRHKVLKVVSWALFISAFTYRIEHVQGDKNTLADIMKT